MFKALLPALLFFLPPAYGKWRQDFSGRITSSSQSYFQELSNETDDFIQLFTSQLDYKVKKGRRFKFNSQLYSRINNSTNTDTEKNFFDLQEAYLEANFFPFKFKLGNNTYNWGVLEAHSPLNVVNQKALFDPLAPIPLGAPTAEVFFEKGLFTLATLYIPRQKRSHFPGEDSRWLPREIVVTGADAEQFTLPETINYSYPNYIELDEALDNNFGLRASLRWNDWDFFVQHFEGASNAPRLRVIASSLGTVLDSDVQLVPIYYRHRSSGLSAVWAPGDFILRFESAYFHSISEESTIEPWSLQNGLAIEKTISLGTSSLTSLLQIYSSQNPSKADNLASSSYRLFDESALLSFLWSPSTSTSLLLSGLYSQPQKAHFIIVGYKTKIFSSVLLDISYSSFEGSRESLLGAYNKNDRADLKLSYLF